MNYTLRNGYISYSLDENGMVVEDNLSVQEIRNKVKELLQ